MSFKITFEGDVIVNTVKTRWQTVPHRRSHNTELCAFNSGHSTAMYSALTAAIILADAAVTPPSPK